MAKAGRKNAYDEIIKPRLEDIAEWARNGVTEADIFKKLGISHDTWYKYKREKSELSELIKNSRVSAVDKIEDSMFEAANGFYRNVTKYMKCKHIEYNEVGKKIREEEVMTPYTEQVYFPPNPTAAIYLLKHWGKSRGYTNDPLSLELKNKELDLKKEIAEKEHW